MEHVVLSHMAEHLSKNNIIIDEQHGFRQRFSCETQLITTIHDWAKSINVCRQTDAILLDFSKAFDSVPHQRLLLKLDYYGISGNLLLWIKAFLSNRSQFVSINGTQSSPKPVLSGVPQGSILGPVLFLLYINDITNCINANLRLFADDCILYSEIQSSQDCLSLQNDLDQLSSWSESWQLNFNVKKCYHLGITCKKFPTLFQYTLNGLHISKVNSTRYLGVTISSNLSWNTHVDNICKNANSTLGLLRRVLGGCSHKVKDTAYRTLVRPKLEYASSVWNPYRQHNISKIESVQRRAARFVFNDYSRYSHVTPMIQSLGWDSLHHRRLLSQGTMFYKIYMGHVGISLPSDVTPNERPSRAPNCRPFKQLKVNNDIYKYSFYPRTVVLWNNISLSSSNIVNIDIFRSNALSFIRSV